MVATAAAFRTSSSPLQMELELEMEMELELVDLLDFVELVLEVVAEVAKTRRRVRMEVMDFIAV